MVVIVWGAEIEIALSTVNVPVVLSGLLDPPLIAYPLILVPEPPDLPYIPFRVKVTDVPESYHPLSPLIVGLVIVFNAEVAPESKATWYCEIELKTTV